MMKCTTFKDTNILFHVYQKLLVKYYRQAEVKLTEVQRNSWELCVLQHEGYHFHFYIMLPVSGVNSIHCRWITVSVGMVKLYRHSKTALLREKPSSLPFCLPQISRRLPWDWNWTSAVRKWLIGAIVWDSPYQVLFCFLSNFKCRVYK